MAVTAKYLADFSEGEFFHVYNRTNNKELLYRSDREKRVFLKKYAIYLSPYFETWCWCLLPNHFHFLVRAKTREKILSYLDTIPSRNLKRIERKYRDGYPVSDQFFELQWQRFFTSYAMTYNVLHQRKGNFFHRPFKRVFVENEQQLTQAIVYIHANPLKHQLTTEFMTYPWSSWKCILSEEPTQVMRAEIIDWFGDIKSFVQSHQDLAQYYYEAEIGIED